MAPLPFPIRICNGLAVTGMLGTARIHNISRFLSCREIKRRLASSGLTVNRFAIRTLIPYCPHSTRLRDDAGPNFFKPSLWYNLYFVLRGVQTILCFAIGGDYTPNSRRNAIINPNRAIASVKANPKIA
jgi:hypothetical protein